MISGDASQLSKGIFIDSEAGGGHIRVLCNWCTWSVPEKVIFTGLDTELPETNWLAEIIEHLVADHSDRLSS